MPMSRKLTPLESIKQVLEPFPDKERPVLLAKFEQRAKLTADLEMLRCVKEYRKDQQRKWELLLERVKRDLL